MDEYQLRNIFTHYFNNKLIIFMNKFYWRNDFERWFSRAWSDYFLEETTEEITETLDGERFHWKYGSDQLPYDMGSYERKWLSSAYLHFARKQEIDEKSDKGLRRKINIYACHSDYFYCKMINSMKRHLWVKYSQSYFAILKNKLFEFLLNLNRFPKELAKSELERNLILTK